MLNRGELFLFEIKREYDKDYYQVHFDGFR